MLNVEKCTNTSREHQVVCTNSEANVERVTVGIRSVKPFLGESPDLATSVALDHDAAIAELELGRAVEARVGIALAATRMRGDWKGGTAVLEKLKEHLALYSEGKWDAYANELAPDATYEEIATRQLVKGRENYIELVKRWKKAFPDLTARVVNGVEADDQMIAEVEWQGTHTGPLEGPLGTIPPTNQRGITRAVIVARTKDGKVVETRHYFDLLSLLAQIGVAPFAGAQPPAEKTAQVPARH